MVMLSSESAERYPLFASWLRDSFVHVVSKSKIMDAFWVWSSFRKEPTDLSIVAARYAFQYGTRPKIIIADFRDKGCGYDVGGAPAGILYGRTFSSDGIALNSRLVGLFETISQEFTSDDVLEDTSLGRDARLMMEVVEVTILHEMIHWSYFETGDNEEARSGYFGNIEFGTENFEREAYGRRIALPERLMQKMCGTKTFAYLGIIGKERVERVKNSNSSSASSEVVFYSVTDVDSKGPASKVGIKVGDEIVKFDGLTFSVGSTQDMLLAKIQSKKSGDRVRIDLRRKTTGPLQTVTVEVVLGTHPVGKGGL